MNETYLNGKVAFSSLAAPTEADLARWLSLSEEAQEAIRVERADRAYANWISHRSLDDILASALKKAEKIESQKTQQCPIISQLKRL